MPLPEQLVNNFTGLPVNDLVVDLNHKADKAESHVAFKGNLPIWVSDAVKLRQLADALANARDAARGNDREAVAALKNCAAAGCKALSMNGVHINMLSLFHNDPNILLGAGYQLKPTTGGKSTPPSLLDLVPEIIAKHGVSGCINLTVSRARQNASIQIMMTTDDPTVEASWIDLGIFTKSRIDIKDLELAAKVSFRVRYHEDGHAGRWSSPVTIIVI